MQLAKAKMTFEKAMERLEEIVDRLEQEEISLEDSIVAYKEGLQLSAICKEKLAVAEGEILLLRKEAGLWEETPFQDEVEEG